MQLINSLSQGTTVLKMYFTSVSFKENIEWKKGENSVNKMDVSSMAVVILQCYNLRESV